ncbi:RING-H2 finger protein ATL54-like [Phragmites australis]|uniref:RING-H2 finger protein ATL54-like n=1 Tax=Phragmites australis TaxID=29695 RepID=UPI002D76AA65|nr:RING-H2 finger protein ATL54-like [Phragmites australis]
MAVRIPLPPALVFPPPPPWLPPPSLRPPLSLTPTDNSSAPQEKATAGVSIAVGIILLVLCCMCSVAGGRIDADAAAADAATAARPQAAPEPDPRDNDEQQLRSSSAHDDDSRPRRASPTAGLPSFTYNGSVKHNVTGSGEETATRTCSVCLGAFKIGETVRLLPVCLHLYHVECIDPWLDAHSTCPLCRSGTDPTFDGSLLPPV